MLQGNIYQSVVSLTYSITVCNKTDNRVIGGGLYNTSTHQAGPVALKAALF